MCNNYQQNYITSQSYKSFRYVEEDDDGDDFDTSGMVSSYSGAMCLVLVFSSLNETQHEQTCHKETRHDETKHDKKTRHDTTLIDLAAKPSQQAVHPMMIALESLASPTEFSHLSYAFFPDLRDQHSYRARLVVESPIVLSPSLASHKK